jgi:hypothetical protein
MCTFQRRNPFLLSGVRGGRFPVLLCLLQRAISIIGPVIKPDNTNGPLSETLCIYSLSHRLESVQSNICIIRSYSMLKK